MYSDDTRPAERHPDLRHEATEAELGKFSAAWAIALTLFSAACAIQPEYQADFAIRNANLVTMTREEVLFDQVVMVRAGRISAIKPDKYQARRYAPHEVDAGGRYLIPGLVDMHAHLGLLLPWDGDPTRAGMVSDLGLYLPNGVTTVRNMRATPGILELRAELASGTLSGPALIVTGPSLHSTLPESFGPKIVTRNEAVDEVRKQKAAGYDLIKVHGMIPQAAFDGVIETAAAEGIAVAGHIQTDKSAAENARLGSIEHIEEIAKLLGDKADFVDAPDILAELAASGVYVTPTLAIFETIADYLDDGALAALYAKPDTAFASAYWRRNMAAENNFFRKMFGENFSERVDYFKAQSERHRTLTRQLHEAGVPLLLGTDAVGLLAPGLSVHQELLLLVEVGLSPYEALRTATVNPANWAGRSGERGVIAAGAAADLVLLKDNPLLDIHATKAVEGVISRGRWLSRTELDSMAERRTLEQ